MVSNQEGGAESLSMKIVAAHGEVELREKLKIPKVKEEDEEEEEEEEEEEDMAIEEIRVQKVCNICGKAFASGKALGGHMRIHVQRDRVLKKELMPHQSIKFKKQLDKVKEKKKTTAGGAYHGLCKLAEVPACKLCSRRFKSLKSLFGHMRSHPDRGWRGINPPSSMGSSISSSSSYSSSLLDADPQEIDDQIEDSDSKETTDMTKGLLRGWTTTAKRGRKAMTAMAAMLPDEDDIRAVSGLMMLSRGRVSSIKREKFDDDCDAAYDATVNADEVSESKADQLNKDKDLERLVVKNKNRRKKMKLCDLELADENNPVDDHKACRMTMQHNKYQVCNLAPVEGRNNDGCHNSLVAKAPLLSRRVADFDLNEMPDEAALELEL